MQKNIHPHYRPVMFKDISTGNTFVIRSTVETRETITEKGVEYPLYNAEISSASHPFFTGKQQFVDTAGRIERFRKRYNIKVDENDTQ